ncbi:Succinate dehydrogenase 2-3 [Hibiscus syriacus]|uniref:Succinate dehydrogenase 2-3 n=1 Tax=Hibiscus syriacus TaxID=106335 RepID=A0A6A2ZWD7_HIBSY|nr:uncharacterized protein LOC120137689 [Hibiscus syriacus]KAE8696240.1 Succinate dehydrogenase 2-3 [Hibiscus syriacus]
MDSGNSGSLQSSSGGSEEFDSRVESISAFLSLIGHGHGNLGDQPPPSPPLPVLQGHSPSTTFDPLSFLDHRSLQLSTTTTANPSSVLDLIWSKNLRSEPSCTDLSGFMASSSAATATQQLFTNQQPQNGATFQSLQPVPQRPESSVSAINGGQTNNKSNTARNPKKRSRASRRAPTTVLTTDTTNFRAMVQEFTGFPAPPFPSSPFPRARLDLFGPLSATLRSNHLDPSPAAPHYLLRPFAQKITPPPFLSSSTADAIVSNPSTNNNNNTSSCSTSINYQLPTELGHLKQPQNLLNINMQNPILNFHSFLQTPPKYPFSCSNMGVPPTESTLKMGGLDESDSSRERLPNMVSPQERDDQNLLRPIIGGFDGEDRRVSNGKASNLSSSFSPNFRGDKELEHVGNSRSEGMVESWICSSD